MIDKKKKEKRKMSIHKRIELYTEKMSLLKNTNSYLSLYE